uniref:Uncharacterized protein n=1 Tax=Aegilops tauschii subsp. strangulata TaxID=200361 RepID=A0A453M8Z9_AEGTS
MLIAELLISIDGVVVVEEVVHLLGDVMCIRSKQETYNLYHDLPHHQMLYTAVLGLLQYHHAE